MSATSSPCDRFAAGLDSRFSAGAYWLEQEAADPPPGDDWLSAAEALTLDAMRVPKRRADWRLGRWTAKRAVAACLDLAADAPTLATIELCPAPSGAPVVFLGGRPVSLALSLSHRDGIAACAVAPAGTSIGCDLEVVEPRSEAFLADYFTAAEQRRLAGSARFVLAALFWSAKESALKALGEGLRTDTRTLEVTLADASQAEESDIWLPLEVRCQDGRIFRGWWQRSGSLIRTLVADPPAAPPTVTRHPG